MISNEKSKKRRDDPERILNLSKSFNPKKERERKPKVYLFKKEISVESRAGDSS